MEPASALTIERASVKSCSKRISISCISLRIFSVSIIFCSFSSLENDNIYSHKKSIFQCYIKIMYKKYQYVNIILVIRF